MNILTMVIKLAIDGKFWPHRRRIVGLYAIDIHWLHTIIP